MDRCCCARLTVRAPPAGIWRASKKLGNRDINRLDQPVASAVIDEDLIVCGHNAKPVLTLGERIGAGAFGQGDPVRQRQWVAIQADDKHRDHQYEARNHHNRQHRDQSFQVGQMWRKRLGNIIHVCDHCKLLHRGQSAAAS